MGLTRSSGVRGAGLGGEAAGAQLDAGGGTPQSPVNLSRVLQGCREGGSPGVGGGGRFCSGRGGKATETQSGWGGEGGGGDLEGKGSVPG